MVARKAGVKQAQAQEGTISCPYLTETMGKVRLAFEIGANSI